MGNTGQNATVVKYWSNTSQTPVKHRSNTGQTPVKHRSSGAAAPEGLARRVVGEAVRVVEAVHLRGGEITEEVSQSMKSAAVAAIRRQVDVSCSTPAGSGVERAGSGGAKARVTRPLLDAGTWRPPAGVREAHRYWSNTGQIMVNTRWCARGSPTATHPVHSPTA